MCVISVCGGGVAVRSLIYLCKAQNIRYFLAQSSPYLLKMGSLIGSQ